MTDSRTEFGPWTQLRIIRARSEIRQGDLASYVGISKSHLCNLESGKRFPTDDMVERLARALNVPPIMIARAPRRAA